MYSNPLNVTVKEIAWLAGIIEGEAHIGFYDTPQVKVKMTDKDIIERVARLFRCNISEFKEYNYKTTYQATASGYKAIEWLFTVYSFLSNRRKYEALKVINKWKEIKTYQRGVNKFSKDGVMYCRIHGPIVGLNRVRMSVYNNTYICLGCDRARSNGYRKSLVRSEGVN